jgi:hypothetical protein
MWRRRIHSHRLLMLMPQQQQKERSRAAEVERQGHLGHRIRCQRSLRTCAASRKPYSRGAMREPLPARLKVSPS